MGLSDDGLPFTTLMYSTGPGFNYTTDENDTVVRYDLTDTNVTGFHFLQQGEVYMEWSNHGGEDVAIYAQGPMAHLFHSLHEQNYIAHAMAYAACIGANTDVGTHCQTDRAAKMVKGKSPGSIAVLVAGAITSLTILA